MAHPRGQLDHDLLLLRAHQPYYCSASREKQNQSALLLGLLERPLVVLAQAEAADAVEGAVRSQSPVVVPLEEQPREDVLELHETHEGPPVAPAHDGEVHLGHDHHLDRRGERVLLPHRHQVPADGAAVLADALVEFEGEQLFELQESHDVVLGAGVDENLAEAVAAEVVDQLPGEPRLHVQQEDVPPRHHHCSHLHHLQLPHLLQQLQLLLPDRLLNPRLAHESQHPVHVLACQRPLLPPPAKQLAQGTVQRNNFIAEFGEADQPGPPGEALRGVVAVEGDPREYFSDCAEEKAGEGEGEFSCELGQQLKGEGEGTEEEEEVKPGHQRVVDAAQLFDPSPPSPLRPLLPCLPLLSAVRPGEFGEEHEEVPGGGEEEAERDYFGQQVGARAEVDQLRGESRHAELGRFCNFEQDYEAITFKQKVTQAINPSPCKKQKIIGQYASTITVGSQQAIIQQATRFIIQCNLGTEQQSFSHPSQQTRFLCIQPPPLFLSFIFEDILLYPMQAIGEQGEDLSTKYTVIKLDRQEHIEKLVGYLQEHKQAKKTSFCRFYLRGLCIMKAEHCKFAHDFGELDLEAEDYKKISAMDWTVSEKEARKRLFLERSDFHQRPLFFIKNLDYLWLHRYQFSERYRRAALAPLSVADLNRNEPARTRIREIMHREQWDKLIDYVEALCPGVDFTISMFSTWFGKLGFEKSQTFCKFGDFMRYLTYVRGYAEVNVVVPPLTARQVFFVRSNGTYLGERLAAIREDSEAHKQNVRRLKEERLKKLPLDLAKRFVCRFYMAGNCEKDREECFYVHCIQDLRYDPAVEFLKEHRQAPKSKEDRLNYVSLYRYYQQHRLPADEEISLQDINSKFGLKDGLRRRVHLELYADFLRRLEEIHGQRALKLALVRREYSRFGFNHTDENKFGQLEACLWELGFHQEELVDQRGEKQQFIYRIPALEEMEQLYRAKIQAILEEEIDASRCSEEGQQLLESSIRRLIYSRTNKEVFEIPLHVYLRRRGGSLKRVLEELFPHYCPFIFFESSQENFKKLLELLKKYFKRQKRFAYRMEDVDGFIRSLSKDEINMNNFVNLKSLVELALLELGKELYFWPIANATVVIDRSHPSKDVGEFKPAQTQLSQAEEERFCELLEEWAVVVDDEAKFRFCKAVLECCSVFGVDLEGKLCPSGYIDFIQVSCRLAGRKHIFIIDVYLLQQQLPLLFPAVRQLLKQIFESEDRLKILHACQQDSIALFCCLGVRLRNVFDTSGVEIYLEQRASYREMREFNHTFEHTLKKVHSTKTPGLNQVLERWHAPKGVNEYKEAMKKVFTDAPRSYFTTRPIVSEFLMYSARDVQDLIEVWEQMSKADPDGVWRMIGEIYTPTS